MTPRNELVREAFLEFIYLETKKDAESFPRRSEVCWGSPAKAATHNGIRFAVNPVVLQGIPSSSLVSNATRSGTRAAKLATTRSTPPSTR